jgi:hypothetical protein
MGNRSLQPFIDSAIVAAGFLATLVYVIKYVKKGVYGSSFCI